MTAQQGQNSGGSTAGAAQQGEPSRGSTAGARQQGQHSRGNTSRGSITAAAKKQRQRRWRRPSRSTGVAGRPVGSLVTVQGQHKLPEQGPVKGSTGVAKPWGAHCWVRIERLVAAGQAVLQRQRGPSLPPPLVPASPHHGYEETLSSCSGH